MKLIKNFVTRDVTALPFKRNLIPRFREEGHENEEKCIDRVAKRISGIEVVERRRTSQLSMLLFLPCMNSITLVESDCAS
jgi:hypothetical protein